MDMDDHEAITSDELRDLMKETVKETLRELGVDASDALEMQRDMSFLRDLRKARDTTMARGVVVSVGILTAAILGALALGVKQWLTGTP